MSLLSALLWQSILRIIIGVIVAIPLALYPMLYFFQEKLIFHPRQEEKDFSLKHLQAIHSSVERISLNTQSGFELHGFLVPSTAKDVGKGWVIYFGGNKELTSDWLADVPSMPEWSLLAVDYRGYGRSTGQPGEEALSEDALLLYDRFIARQDGKPVRVVAMGRSLGSGVAVYLAANRPVSGVILITPYDSLVEVAQGYYPYVPVSWLLKHRFDSLTIAPRLTMPALFLIAGKDIIIHPYHAERLADAWHGPKQIIRYVNADHDNIPLVASYWQNIHGFLTDLP